MPLSGEVDDVRCAQSQSRRKPQDAGTLSPRRWRARNGERGSALVEFAIVMPILMLVVFGVIEFGLAYSDKIAVRQGVREAARQGAVGNFGPSFTTGAPCYLTGVTTASTHVKNLMCLAKSEIGLDGAKTRVKVLSGSPSFTAEGTFAHTDSIIVCAQYPLDSVSGMFAPILGGTVLHSKTSIRIEVSDLVETGGEETPPAGGDWSWCTVSTSSS
jgi:hypothetical protein